MHLSRRLAVALCTLILAASTLAASAPTGSPASDHRVPVVVMLADDADARATAAELEQRHDGELRFVYEHALRGFAGDFPKDSLDGMQRDPRVTLVELDQAVEAYAQTIPTGVRRIFADTNATIDIDGDPANPVDVDVAVLDTGIDVDRPSELDVVGGTHCTSVVGLSPSCSDSGYDDDNGHGTHVAGTIGAIDSTEGVVGVAPGARLWAVKVLDATGSGFISQIVAGVDWVTARADTIEVANMSLGCECEKSESLDTAIANSVAAGIVYAVAAGNSDADSKDYIPANHRDVITVSALADFDGAAGGNGEPTCRDDEDDTLANFSNFGTTIEVAAPGVCILSTVPKELDTSDGIADGYARYNGTSMASPHVAGAAAILASGSNDPTSKADVDAIRSTIEREGNFDWVDQSKDGEHEPLLDVGNSTVFDPQLVNEGSGGDGGTTNSPPTASFTSSCTDLDCSFDGSGSSDSDGTISSYAWDFGDGTTGSGQTVSHTYAAGGSYTVTLTVTDDAGATDTSSQTITVTEPESGFTLGVEAYKVKGVQHAKLTWSGTTATSVDVYRDGAVITTTANDGEYVDNIGNRGGGSYTYKVCDAGTTTCSNEATATF